MRHAAIRATDSFDRLATLANLSTVTLATLRPVQPVGKCYSVASLTVCEFGFQDRKPWRLTSDTKYRECLQRYVSSFGERY